jgi:hypothetical protein
MNLRMNDDTTAASEDPTISELFGSDDVDADMVLQFPSADFPAPPAFRLRVPATWLAVPVPEAEMAVRDPVAVDGFHPNVIVRVRRTAASETVTDDLFRSVAVGDAADGHEVLSEEVRADLDTPARWLLVGFRGPDGRPLLARHLLIYVPGSEHVASIVTAVGTIPASAAAELGPRIDRIVGSLRLAP